MHRQLTTHLMSMSFALLLTFHGVVAWGQEADDEVGIFEADIERLMNISVISAAGVPQEWFRTPAAMYVITGEDVRRTGHRTLAEALRLAPGVFVGRINSQALSVGMRGFNGSLANKTLVLIDGRTVYDPLFGGVYWNVQDVVLEDLDRIEVIRGPGPTLWGANAVNGVINIITKSAKDTQGTYITGAVGSYEQGFAEARHGMQVGANSWLRVYGKWFERDHLVDSSGMSAHDDWNMVQGGFRFDAEGDENTLFTLQGDVYDSNRIGEQLLLLPEPGQHLMFRSDIRDARNSGGNTLFRVQQQLDDRNGWSLQGYYDRTERVTNGGFRVQRDTFDMEFRHNFALGDRHHLHWGLRGQNTRDESSPGPNTILSPSSRSLTSFSAFLQDTITLEPNRWYAMVGAKFLHNEFTGAEVQPSARIWWTPNDRQMYWAAVSRPVRIPTRIEGDGSLIFGFVDTGLATGGPPSGVFAPLAVTGNSGLDAEELHAYEVGHRVRLTNNVTLDTSAFYNDYHNLIYVSPSVVGPWNNNGYAESYGTEFNVNWRVSDNWRLEASYSFVDVQIHGPVLTLDEASTPHHLANVRSHLDLTDDLEFNSILYYVDRVPAVNAGDYLRLDLGLTWHISPNFDVSIWGLNLLEKSHREFSALEVERSFFVQGSVRF